MPKCPGTFRLIERDDPPQFPREEQRPSARERGYTTRWDKARAGFLARNPLCAECRKLGKVTEATVVDHITPHRGDKKLFWDRKNWQPLCARCHNRKTRRGE